MADRSLRLNIDTQELDAKTKAELMELYDYPGIFIFARGDIKQEDLVNLPEIKVDKGQKTPAQMFRNRLFVFHKEKKIAEDFDAWYKRELEKIGQAYLDKLQ